jgi:hypothetical protein
MRAFLPCLLSLALLSPVLAARAAEPMTAVAAAPVAAPTSPYEAFVAVEDQSNATRDSALRKALAEVLARVCGRQDPAIASLLPRAMSLVQSFGFEHDPTSGALQLRASFDPRAVDQALHGAGLPVFGTYAGAVEEVVVPVDGIRTADDYSRALSYLRGLRGVSSVQLYTLVAGHAEFRLRMEGGATALRSAAATGSVLRAGPADGPYLLVN